MMEQRSVIEGSSKVFSLLEDGFLLMQFKDDIHGRGREAVISESGRLRKIFTYYFYRFLERNGIKTHLTQKPLHDEGIVVERCKPIKMEFLVRNFARGYWVDEHKLPFFEGGTRFSKPVVEMCIKMKKTLADGRVIDDPRVNAAIARELHFFAKDSDLKGAMLEREEDFAKAESLALLINCHYQSFLKEYGWTLEDFKFELGRKSGSNDLILIDEISPDSSRIRDENGGSLTKDLFREKRPFKEIVQNYQLLANAMKERTLSC